MYLYAAYILHVVYKMHVDTRININATWESPPSNSSDRRRVLSAASSPAAGQQAVEDPNIACGATQVSPRRRSPTVSARASPEAMLVYTQTPILSTSPDPCAHSAARTQQHTRAKGRSRPAQPRQIFASRQLRARGWNSTGQRSSSAFLQILRC